MVIKWSKNEQDVKVDVLDLKKVIDFLPEKQKRENIYDESGNGKQDSDM